MNPWFQFLIGVFCSILIASVAYKFHSLSVRGFFASVLVGTIIFGLGGIAWAILLLTFLFRLAFYPKCSGTESLGLMKNFQKDLNGMQGRFLPTVVWLPAWH